MCRRAVFVLLTVFGMVASSLPVWVPNEADSLVQIEMKDKDGAGIAMAATELACT